MSVQSNKEIAYSLLGIRLGVFRSKYVRLYMCSDDCERHLRKSGITEQTTQSCHLNTKPGLSCRTYMARWRGTHRHFA